MNVMELSVVEQFLLLDFFDDEDDDIAIKYLSLLHCSIISNWPYRLERPYLSSHLLFPNGAQSFFINANSSSLESMTRLDRCTFDLILEKFTSIYEKSFANQSRTGIPSRRRLKACTALGLTLHWLSSGVNLTSLSFMSGVVKSTLSRTMRHSIKCLGKSLDQIPCCSLEKPSNTYLQDVGQVAEQAYGTVMSGCIGLVDGSIHPLKKDQAAQWNIHDKKNHLDYNGWKSV
jgi:hypothetical protein